MLQSGTYVFHRLQFFQYPSQCMGTNLHMAVHWNTYPEQKDSMVIVYSIVDTSRQLSAYSLYPNSNVRIATLGYASKFK